jgi:hypothetical protein
MRRPHVVGAGVALGGIGVLLRMAAESNYDRYEAELATACGQVGCLPEEIPQSTRDLESRGSIQNKLAITSWVMGGAAVVTGVVWAIRNYPRPVQRRGTTALIALPMRGGAQLSVSGRF